MILRYGVLANKKCHPQQHLHKSSSSSDPDAERRQCACTRYGQREAGSLGRLAYTACGWLMDRTLCICVCIHRMLHIYDCTYVHVCYIRIKRAASLQVANSQRGTEEKQVCLTRAVVSRACLRVWALLVARVSFVRQQHRRHFHARSIATGSARHQKNTSASFLGKGATLLTGCTSGQTLNR